MISIVKMLGKGLLKKDKHYVENKSTHIVKAAKKCRKKAAVDNFLRDVLGTHLIEKKF